jgi:hypothetical protein
MSSKDVEKRIAFWRGGGVFKPFDTINEFNVYWGYVRLKALKSVFTNAYLYCLLSRCYFEKITKDRSTWEPLPEDLPDKLKPFVRICCVTLDYETPNLPGRSWLGLFIVVERLPLPEDMCVDCNISIVFTSQIRKKLEAILEARRRHWQQLLKATEMAMVEESEAEEMNEKDQEDKAAREEGYDHDQDSHETQEGEKGRETRPNEKQGDVEDVDHGDWVIVEGSDVPICMNGTRAEVTMTSINGTSGRKELRWMYDASSALLMVSALS